MSELRQLNLEDLRKAHFTHHDVFETFEDRFERQHKLKSAMAQTNADHEPISLTIKLADGELVVYFSNLIDYENDFVEVMGGFAIPVKAIVDVGL